MSFTLTFFICQCVCLSPHLPLPSLSPISTSISFKTLITRSASTLATPPVTLVPTTLISCFIQGVFVLIIRLTVFGAVLLFQLHVWTHICISMFDCLWTSASVCMGVLSPHVSASLLLADATRAIYDSNGTRYWRGMRRMGKKERREGGDPW